MISANVTLYPYPVYPLGMSMVAAALSGAGHEVQQLDYLQQERSLESVLEEVKRFQPGMIGISVRNIDNVNLLNTEYYIHNVKNMVEAIRTVSDARIVLGGAGFSLIPEQILEETGADFGVIGEGEQLMVAFADGAEPGGAQPRAQPPGQLTGRDGRPRRGSVGAAAGQRLDGARARAHDRGDPPRERLGDHHAPGLGQRRVHEQVAAGPHGVQLRPPELARPAHPARRSGVRHGDGVGDVDHPGPQRGGAGEDGGAPPPPSSWRCGGRRPPPSPAAC